MRARGWIAIVEAAYDVDAPEEAWLARLVDAGAKILDEGLGALAYVYDARDPARTRILRFAATPNQKAISEAALQGAITIMGADYVRASYLSLPCATVTETPGFVGSQGEATFAALGIGDALAINGVDPTGVGVWLGAPLRRATKLTPARRLRGARLGAHLAASYRLRRRLAAASAARRAPWGADAILSPRGKLEHAEREVDVTAARSLLQSAAVAIDRARGRLRRIDEDEALGEWKGLVDGRWSLVDKFDRDGKRFVLARRNEPGVGGLALLTERERQVVALAALGHTNKLIAYELGIDAATVRVLLSRAARKLGAATRDELARMVDVPLARD